jgi:hypothetical protein
MIIGYLAFFPQKEFVLGRAVDGIFKKDLKQFMLSIDDAFELEVKQD